MSFCPKCGYDQSGEIATWESVCPLEGQCPECGIEFEWSQVFAILDEWESTLDWYSEHAQGWIDLVQRTPMTLVRLIFPIWFFRSVNHRRAIKLGMLFRWVLVVCVVLHVLVTPIGVFGNKGSGHWSRLFVGGEFQFYRFIDYVIDALNGLLFPYTYVEWRTDGFITSSVWSGYEWYDFSQIGFVGIGSTLSWVLLISFVLFLRSRWSEEWKREAKLLGRCTLLSLLSVFVYLQVVRIGFAIHAGTGMTAKTDWVPYAYLISLLVLIFWQQVLWTHAVRKIWEIKRSWIINIGGCFGSFIGGLFFAYWVLA